jgi:NAD(P)-dependent dehydrogenase (short-subunit alcohol dehydrogenase family)
MPTTLITGCDYGIGFEFARQYAAADWTVHAVCLDADSRAKIESLDGEAQFHHADIADPPHWPHWRRASTATPLIY